MLSRLILSSHFFVTQRLPDSESNQDGQTLPLLLTCAIPYLAHVDFSTMADKGEKKSCFPCCFLLACVSPFCWIVACLGNDGTCPNGKQVAVVRTPCIRSQRVQGYDHDP